MLINRSSARKYPYLVVLTLSLVILMVCDSSRVRIQASSLFSSEPLDSPGGEALLPAASVTFTGDVSYAPAAGSARPQAGVPVTLYGISGAGDPVELGSTTSASNGTFRLGVGDPSADSFQIVIGNPRGFVPGDAGSSGVGLALDPNTVAFPGSVSGIISGTEFSLHDPLVLHPLYHSRYLIVTRDAIVPALDDFIAYKQSQGFEVIVKTVEELDPFGGGGNTLRTQIRSYEQSLWFTEESLKYVLLIGTHDTVPFLLVNATGPDQFRLPEDGAWEWDGTCHNSSLVEANNCGRATDWYYVDLASNWDSNSDGVLGEAFWARPEKLQEWKDDNILPVNFIPDDPPEFHTSVFVGRLMLDSPVAVKTALQASIDFERDGGDWKRNTLLAGAMASVGGRTWDNKDGVYKDLPAPTDMGYLMEQVWTNILEPGDYTRVRLYEKESPYGELPPRTSGFAVDDPLTRDALLSHWSSQAYGLVKLAGHGSSGGVYRHYWKDDKNTNNIPEHIISPDDGITNPYELSEPQFVSAWYLSQTTMPGGKVPIVMAYSCSTGAWYHNSNLPATLLTEGRIAAWIGGSAKLYYKPGWQSPFGPTGGLGGTIDYLITDALLGDGLPLGEAVWTGLADYFAWSGGPTWAGKSVNVGFLSWDLYGDPSLNYWGNGADLVAPWPMFQYDWPGRGETALLGPDTENMTTVRLGWSQPISATATGDWSPSPVLGQDGRIVIGDGDGVVHAFAPNGTELWSYATGGPIVNAAALSADGTVYAKSEDGMLYAIDKNGSLLWSETVGESTASPKIGRDGTIYVGGSEQVGIGGETRYFLAVYRPDGTRLATSEVDGRVTTAPSIDKDGHTVWVGTELGTLYHLDLGRGGSSWSLTPGSPIGGGLANAEDDGILVVPSADGSLIGFDTDLETVKWTFTAGDAIYSAPALGANDQVFVGSRDGRLYAISLDDGIELWHYDTGGPVDSAPALDPVNVFVVGGDPATVYALRRSSGALRWTIPMAGSAEGGSSPAIGHSRTLYVVSPSSVGGGGDAALISIGPWNWTLPSTIYETVARPDEIQLDILLGDPLAFTQVERRVPGGDWGMQDTLKPGISQFIDTNTVPGQIYNYRVLAVPAAGSRSSSAASPLAPEPSDYSAAVTVQALPEPPKTPAAPTVTARSATELRLTWTPSLMDAVTLHVLRQGPGEALSETIASLPGGVTEFTDSELEPASKYAYWLQAFNDAGKSAPGDPGHGSTFAQTVPAPSLVVVHPLDTMTFEVCWTPGDPGLPTVVARRMAGQVQLEYMGTVDPGGTCFTDTNASFYMYEYWVKHRDLDGENESDWARSALTPAPGFNLGYNRIYLPLILKD